MYVIVKMDIRLDTEENSYEVDVVACVKDYDSVEYYLDKLQEKNTQKSIFYELYECKKFPKVSKKKIMKHFQFPLDCKKYDMDVELNCDEV